MNSWFFTYLLLEVRGQICEAKSKVEIAFYIVVEQVVVNKKRFLVRGVRVSAKLVTEVVDCTCIVNIGLLKSILVKPVNRQIEHPLFKETIAEKDLYFRSDPLLSDDDAFGMDEEVSLGNVKLLEESR